MAPSSAFYYVGFLLTLANCQTEEPFKPNVYCGPVHRLRDCWNDYFDLPSCGNEVSRVVTCGESIGRSMEKCDSKEILVYAGYIIRSFRQSDTTICSNKDLRDFFRENQYCWSSGRHCIRDLMFSESGGPLRHECDLTPSNFSESTANYDKCIRDVPKACMKQVERYSKLMQTTLPCAGAFIGPSLVILTFLAALITSLT